MVPTINFCEDYCKEAYVRKSLYKKSWMMVSIDPANRDMTNCSPWWTTSVTVVVIGTRVPMSAVVFSSAWKVMSSGAQMETEFIQHTQLHYYTIQGNINTRTKHKRSPPTPQTKRTTHNMWWVVLYSYLFCSEGGYKRRYFRNCHTGT